MTDPQQQSGPPARGIVHGAGAYLFWGLLPLYFKLLAPVAAAEIVAHRILWSLLLVLGLVAMRGTLTKWLALFRTPAILRLMLASASLIAINWLTYIWAVNHDHVVSASLGYFLNPLVNVLLGMLVFHERLDRIQWGAVALAAGGVATMAMTAPGGLWISLVLALSFGLYGMVRKFAPIGSLEGLASETLLLAAPAFAYLLWLGLHGTLSFGRNPGIDTLLVLSAVMTSLPLLLFASAARQLRYATLGLLQYIAPTLQFLLGVLAFGEPFTARMALSFALIWSGLAVFSGNALAQRRRQRTARV